jgi:hypothetical protein
VKNVKRFQWNFAVQSACNDRSSRYPTVRIVESYILYFCPKRRSSVTMYRSAKLLSVAVAFPVVLAVASRAQQQDFSKVEIKTTKLAGTLYMLEGQGGAIGALAGPDGVLMVDSQFAPLTKKIVAAIRAITPGPIRFLINTHVHGDHTGGNANLGAMGVTIIARPMLRARLEKPAPGAGGAPAKPAPPAALPLLTPTVTPW